jgi:hypothetical protein
MGDGRIFLKSLHDASFSKIFRMSLLFRPDPSRWTVPLKPWYLFTFLQFKFFSSCRKWRTFWSAMSEKQFVSFSPLTIDPLPHHRIFNLHIFQNLNKKTSREERKKTIMASSADVRDIMGMAPLDTTLTKDFILGTDKKR